MERKIIKKLKAIVGKDHLSIAAEDLLCYSYDGTGLEYPPAAVAFPGSVEEICAIMRLATSESFPVVPRGAGTGMTGGALPVKGGLVLVMSRLNRILDIDEENQVAVVEPGVINGQFQDELARRGLFYPPDPASRNFCTMGGNVAECAGGPSAVKYGVTRDYVLGLEVVLPDGSLMHTGVRTAKGVVGYDLTRLFVGSEGTLGIVTKITVRVIAKPEATVTFLVLTDSLKSATELVPVIMKAGILPCTLEYMDRTAIRIVSTMLPGDFPKETQALLLIELDGDEQTVKSQSSKLWSLLDGKAGVLETRQAGNSEEVEMLWAARRSISPASFKLKPHKISEDVVVPRTRIVDLVTFAEELAEETGLVILTFGHAGDGNIHVNIMLDRDNAQELKAGIEAKKRLFEHVIDLSGTLSGEHGVGITKSQFLEMELDETSLNVMKKIKKAFDPQDILNPGKIFSRLPESKKD